MDLTFGLKIEPKLKDWCVKLQGVCSSVGIWWESDATSTLFHFCFIITLELTASLHVLTPHFLYSRIGLLDVGVSLVLHPCESTPNRLSFAFDKTNIPKLVACETTCRLLHCNPISNPSNKPIV